MSKPPVPAYLVELLEPPNPAVIATVRPDGQPVTVATWYLWEDGRVLVNLDESRRRLDHLRSDPRVSITVLNGADWYSHVSLQGRMTSLEEDTGLAESDRISRRYTGHPYPNRERTRYNAWIEIDSWHAWGPAVAERKRSAE